MTTMNASIYQRRRILAPRELVPADLVRCVCRNCGSHVHAFALRQTVSGLCGTCASCDIVLLGAQNPPARQSVRHE